MRKSNLHITGIQFDILWENKDYNLRHLESKFLQKLDPETDLVVLPEMFATGFSMNTSEIAEDMDGRIVNWMLEMANQYNCAISGSAAISENDSVFNRMVWVSPNGEINFYDKRHLFGYGNETRSYQSGKEKKIIDIKGWKVCPLICYDLRFPVWSRNSENFDLLIYIASWPDTRIKAWTSLLKARAIENLCYVIGINRVGADSNNLNYVGKSIIVDHQGESLAYLEDEEAMISAVLSHEELMSFRNKFGFLEDRDKFEITH